MDEEVIKSKNIYKRKNHERNFAYQLLESSKSELIWLKFKLHLGINPFKLYKFRDTDSERMLYNIFKATCQDSAHESAINELLLEQDRAEPIAISDQD